MSQSTVAQEVVIPYSESGTLSTEFLTPLSPSNDSTHAHFCDNLQPPSFESILSGTSQSPYSRVAFSDFLRKIHCSENLEFLLNSNQYLISSNAKGEYDHELKQLWFLIYTNHISSDGLKEVNIPHDLKEDLTQHFEQDKLPSASLMEQTMISVKELLRDGYVQFIQSVRRVHYNDRVNENYSLLPSPTEELHSPFPSMLSQIPHPTSLPESFQHQHERKRSESCSPLNPTNDGSRCVSPLSNSELSLHQRNSQLSLHHQHLNTIKTQMQNGSEEVIPRSVEEEFEPETRPAFHNGDAVTSSTNSSDTEFGGKRARAKSSIGEASIGLKKFAGKFRWRRMSSNSSTGSN